MLRPLLLTCVLFGAVFDVSRDVHHAAAGDETHRPEANRKELTTEMKELRDKVRRCLAIYFHRPESSAAQSPWGVMHSLIAFGVDTELYVAERKVNAIGWLCWNGTCRGQRLFVVRDGQPVPRYGPGVQGHDGQFLSMLAQSRVKLDYEIRIGDNRMTVADLVEYEKKTCRPRTELTFKLIGLSHYLDSNDTWRSASGAPWSIPRLVQEELGQPIVGGTCGGTHRLMALSYAVYQRRRRGEAIDGQWKRAEKYIDDYIEYTFKLQNSDGSFSTNWFARRGDWGGPKRHLETTGHILEWLVFAVPEEQLADPRVVQAVDYLTTLLTSHRTDSWHIGSAGHALHALAIYDERMFGGRPGERGLTLAKVAGTRLHRELPPTSDRHGVAGGAG